MLNLTAALIVLVVTYGLIKVAMLEREPLSSCAVHMYTCGICFFTFIAMLSINEVGWRKKFVLVSFINFVTRGFVASAVFRLSQSWLIPLMSNLPQMLIWRLNIITASFIELFTVMLLTVIGVSQRKPTLKKQSMTFGRCIAGHSIDLVTYASLIEAGLVFADELLAKHFLLIDEPNVWMSIIRVSSIIYTCGLFSRWGANAKAFTAAMVSGTMALAAHLLYTQVFPPHYAATCSVLVAALQLLVA